MKTLIASLTIMCVILAGCTEQQSSPASITEKPTVKVQSLQPRALIILKNGLNSDNAYIRTHAIEIAAETDSRQMITDISARLADSSAAVRFAAAAAMGDILAFGCQEQLLPLLNDTNESVQLAAAYALVKLNQDQYHETIRQGAKNPDQSVRANAVLLLGKLGNQDDLNLLYWVLHDENSKENVRLQAVESIARLKDREMYRSKLWALLISKYADDRVIGIRGMGALGTDEAKNAILTMLQDDVLEVRLAAAEQLGRLGDKHGEMEVYSYFQSKPDLNQINIAANNIAVMAIGRIQSNRLNAFLPDVLASQSESIRLLAAQSILLQTK